MDYRMQADDSADTAHRRKTCIKQPGREMRKSPKRFRLLTSVLIGDAPPPNQPGPTFTKVTAPGHEDDPDWTNKVSRDGQIVVLGTGFTDAVTAEFSTDGTPETFNVTARTATSITGQIAGGLEAGGTLVMELKDGDNVIDTASIDVVE